MLEKSVCGFALMLIVGPGVAHPASSNTSGPAIISIFRMLRSFPTADQLGNDAYILGRAGSAGPEKYRLTVRVANPPLIILD